MTKLVLTCIAGGWLFCGACAQHPKPSAVNPTDSITHPDTAADNHFPIAEMLESEIRQVDSTPLAVQKLVIANGRRDSDFIKSAEFDALALQFVVPELRDSSFERNFTETSFIDNATGTATFTYSTNNDALPLRRVDVVAAPQGAAHQLQSVYLERTRVSGDSSILDKMFWRAGRRFQVLSVINVKGQPPVQRQLIVGWDLGKPDNE